MTLQNDSEKFQVMVSEFPPPLYGQGDNYFYFYYPNKTNWKVMMRVTNLYFLHLDWSSLQPEAKAYLISWANPLTVLPHAAENFLGMTKKGLEARNR